MISIDIYMSEFGEEWFRIAKIEQHAKELGGFDKCECDTCKDEREKRKQT